MWDQVNFLVLGLDFCTLQECTLERTDVLPLQAQPHRAEQCRITTRIIASSLSHGLENWWGSCLPRQTSPQHCHERDTKHDELYGDTVRNGLLSSLMPALRNAHHDSQHACMSLDILVVAPQHTQA